MAAVAGPLGWRILRAAAGRGPTTHTTCHDERSDAAVYAFNQGPFKVRSEPTLLQYVVGISVGILAHDIWIETAVIVIHWPNVKINLDIFVYSLNEKMQCH